MSVNTVGEIDIFDDFLGSSSLEIWGVGTEVVSFTSDEPGGVIALTTGGTDDNNCAIVAKGFNPSLNRAVIEVKIKAASLATMAFNVGFTDTLDGTTPVLPFEYATTSLTTAPANGCAFLFDTDATTDVLRIGAVKANVDTVDAAASEPVALAADTYVTLRVEIEQNGDVNFLADGKLVRRVVGAVTANINYMAYAMVETRTGGAASIELDYFRGACVRQ